MHVDTFAIADLKLITPRLIGDDRGFFTERYNKARFDEAVGRSVDFVQDNHSRSRRGVLRGLHYQVAPCPQGKLVSVLQGEVFDVAVDVRQSSPTFGQYAGVLLSADNRHQLWVPEGFAHGFLVLSDSADVFYKTSGFYAPQSDRAIAWNDPDIGIDWPLDASPLLSARDEAAPRLSQAELFA